MKKAIAYLLAVAALFGLSFTFFLQNATAQTGFGINAAQFFKRVGTAIVPANSSWTLGSSSNRVAGVYTSTLDALTLTISGSVPGNLTVTGTISVLGSGTSTFAGPISSGTVSSTRVQSYRYDFSDSGNIRWEQIPGVSQAKLTQGETPRFQGRSHHLKQSLRASPRERPSVRSVWMRTSN